MKASSVVNTLKCMAITMVTIVRDPMYAIYLVIVGMHAYFFENKTG